MDFFLNLMRAKVLIRERHFQIRSLVDSSVRALDITADSQIEFIDKKSCGAEYADTFLQIPLSSNYRSRDSWFVGKLRRFLVFFQVLLKSNEYWSIVVAEKTAEEIMQVLLGWSLSLNLPLHELCFLTDRGGEFEDISPYVKSHVMTAAYSPQSNGSVERIHKELGAMCRLYETTPDVIADLWRKRNFSGKLFI
jgi:hypothetical protein